MRLLHSSCGRRALPGCLCSELLPWRLSSSGFTGSLLGTGHLVLTKSTYENGQTSFLRDMFFLVS